MLTVANLAPFKSRDPYLYESLVQIVSAVNALGQKMRADARPGLFYFAESDTTLAFAAP